MRWCWIAWTLAWAEPEAEPNDVPTPTEAEDADTPTGPDRSAPRSPRRPA